MVWAEYRPKAVFGITYFHIYRYSYLFILSSCLAMIAPRVLDALGEIATEAGTDPVVMLSGVKNLFREKWDWSLPEHLLRKSFASSLLDMQGAFEVAAEFQE